MAPDVVALMNYSGNKVDTFKQIGKGDITKLQEEENGDQLIEMQEFNMQIVNASFIRNEIDIYF